MNSMRSALPCFLSALAGCFLLACNTTPKQSETTTFVTAPGASKNAPEIAQDDDTRLVRSTERNVKTWQELRLQGKAQQMEAVRRTIARSVDDNFDVFRTIALESDTIIVRNMAVKCIPFAFEMRDDARDTLLVLCKDRDPTLVQNAVLGLGILLHKDTDLTTVISLLASGNTDIRTNAGTALARLFLVKETPRILTPQYNLAIDRLVTMLHDPASIRSRRAAAWALANMRHPDTLPNLISAMKDDDEQVQMGGLRGIQLLGDQRALEAVIDFLDHGPTTQAASWAQQALESIAVQGGFARTKAELADLGTNARSWRKWFRNARMD